MRICHQMAVQKLVSHIRLLPWLGPVAASAWITA